MNVGYKLLKSTKKLQKCFYLSNTKLTNSDKILRDYILLKSYKKESIKISEIIEMGDPGI